MKADRLRTLRLVFLADSLNVWSSSRVHHVLLSVLHVVAGSDFGDNKCFDESRNPEGEKGTSSCSLPTFEDNGLDGMSSMYLMLFVSKRSLFFEFFSGKCVVDALLGQPDLVSSRVDIIDTFLRREISPSSPKSAVDSLATRSVLGTTTAPRSNLAFVTSLEP